MQIIVPLQAIVLELRLFNGEAVVALEQGSVWAFVVLEYEIFGIKGFLEDKKVESTLSGF